MPIFSVIEKNQTIVEKVEIDGAEKKVESFESLGGCENGVNGASRLSCTNHNKVLYLLLSVLSLFKFLGVPSPFQSLTSTFCINMNVLLKL